MDISRSQTAQDLRSLANKIEHGKVELRSVSSHIYQRDDRTPVETFRVSVAQKPKQK